MRTRALSLDGRDIAAEIIRRAGRPNGPDAWFILVSDPPTPEERLQLAAATLQGVSVLLVPRKPMTEEEWIARYCTPEA
jgi:hypothetical protein